MQNEDDQDLSSSIHVALFGRGETINTEGVLRGRGNSQDGSEEENSEKVARAKDTSSDIAIRVSNLSKCYQIYNAPSDRLKQSIYPRLQRFIGKPAKQYFSEFWAINDVSFEVKKGEVVGIVGRNGSGKSTLLQLICGTLNPTSGNIQTHGRIAALLELGSGFNPDFTGRENVYMNGAVLGLSQEEIDNRFDDIAAFADIGAFIEQPVRTYSSGMYVRLAFSVSINVDPKILVVDEALTVGDELFQRKCYSRIEDIRAKGATILFVSHSGSTIVELCDRAILMDSGNKLVVGSPKHIIGCYHKLLYAPEDKTEYIRKEIRKEGQESFLPVDTIQSLTNKHCGSVEEQTMLEESFDPHLKPSTVIEYESHGAYILSPEVLTVEGKQVNNLLQGKTYFYTYTVRFDRSVNNVRFGMMIKTISGLELGGSVSSNNTRDSLPFVTSGTSYHVKFRFQAALNPGIYFLNAGVLGEVNGSETFLQRLVDVAMFRVLPDDKKRSTGIIDFNCYSKVELLDSQ